MGQNISWSIAVSPAVYSISFYYEEYVQKKKKQNKTIKANNLNETSLNLEVIKIFPDVMNTWLEKWKTKRWN